MSLLDREATSAATYEPRGWTGQIAEPTGAAKARASLERSGYDVDVAEARLGAGSAAFAAARAALRRLEVFRLGWTDAVATEPAPAEGMLIGVRMRNLGLWSVLVSRVIHVEDEQRADGTRAYWFTYGTLPHHVERGEERFQVTLDAADDTVTYGIYAYSRPHHPLARLGYPYVRRRQRRFARDSVAHLRDLVA